MKMQDHKNHNFSGLTGFGEGDSELVADSVPAIREALRDSLGIFNSQCYCVPGEYPWDYWQHMALKRGVPTELATLGRALMREASQHAWDDRLRSLCGWSDEGRRMIALALRSPETARRRWGWLLASDGQRIDPATYEWVGEDSWQWPSLRRRWIKKGCG